VRFPASFANRYPKYAGLDELNVEMRNRLFASLSKTLEDKVFSNLVANYAAIKYSILNQVICAAHGHLCEEIGSRGLINENLQSYDSQNLVGRVLHYLAMKPDPKVRLSFIEHIVQAALATGNLSYFEGEWIEALNKPLKRAGLAIVFKDREFCLVDDDLLTEEVDKPLWDALSKPGLEVAHEFMKRALVERDTGGLDPALQAAKALESVLGQIADDRGIETRKNAGAAHLLDKICQAGLIEAWEREIFKSFFRDVRNPLSHGVTAGPIPVLTEAQTEWSIRFCMTTITRLLG
jgi:hypothetical protein